MDKQNAHDRELRRQHVLACVQRKEQALARLSLPFNDDLQERIGAINAVKKADREIDEWGERVYTLDLHTPVGLAEMEDWYGWKYN